MTIHIQYYDASASAYAYGSRDDLKAELGRVMRDECDKTRLGSS